MKTAGPRKVRVLTLIVAILLPLGVGGFSAFLTAEDIRVYADMNRPPLAPPGWVFPVVWTLLYVLMGVASYLVYTSDADPTLKRRALTVYCIQLAMNFFWSTLFFTYARLLTAFIWLTLLWLFTLGCTVRFYYIRPAAGLMMGGLLVWTTFAGYLNLACYLLSITPMPIALY